MPTKVQPIILRDVSRGRINNDAVDESLIPPNSVEHAMNFNFDTKIGSAVVRPGSLILGTSPTVLPALGLSEFVSGSNNLLVAGFAGATNGGIYPYNHTPGAWGAVDSSATITGNPTIRFAVLGGSIFMVDGVDAMQSSTDGVNWLSGNTYNCIATVIPSLVFRSKQHLLCAGDPNYPDRVFLSSLIDMTQSPFIDWYISSSPPTSGTAGWIDINPDDNSHITGFAETSDTCLVFKSQGMYRLDVISQTVDSQNIWNIGAVSQEAIVNCQGIVYFFSGYNICQTAGDIPQEISRLGVADFISAIPQANWVSHYNGSTYVPGVAAGTDGLNVYFSIGTVTLNLNKNDQKTYNNVVLKFSPRDQAWSIHSYQEQPTFFCQYTPTNTVRQMIGSCSSGNTNTYNVGFTDNGKPINYELIFQEQECGERSHLNQISDKIVVYGDGLNDAQLQVQGGDSGNDFQDIEMDLSKRVNIGQDINVKDYFFSFRIFGESSGTAPIFEGIEVPEIYDLGIVKK